MYGRGGMRCVQVTNLGGDWTMQKLMTDSKPEGGRWIAEARARALELVRRVDQRESEGGGGGGTWSTRRNSRTQERRVRPLVGWLKMPEEGWK